MDGRYHLQGGPQLAAFSPSQEFAVQGYWRTPACTEDVENDIHGVAVAIMKLILPKRSRMAIWASFVGWILLPLWARYWR